ncbi:hypothetical protein ASD11_13530 [Aeromicrobium sp. Root495]|uniref:lysine N(6)-hydroxylase/L-ornithine N(5)-oxygenase family protein n=1 Tax=Aeromicrobium sp. Root495 TaxID=1736550 RepID=UPI0007016EE3|nr:SidA/IucD/PvdA family monooxygenase [Aeromicrobium sp. Root495]KQY60461.1 hypothetical protein ASD11_13530 [Aeromicrobium sp. Root495]
MSTAAEDAVHDFVAVGLGPFNLGLACLAEPVDGLDGVVLEARDHFSWHPGMMLDDATLQVPFMADLVTMADPTSSYSFLAFLKATGRLYPFYIRERFYPHRAEYDAYCRWAAERLRCIRFGRHVEQISFDANDDLYVVRARTAQGTETYRARQLVLGTGTTPHVPDAVRGLDGPVLHSADYLDRKAWLQEQGSVTIVGSGQSAAEVYRDLLDDVGPYRLTWLTRSARFFPMEYTKLTLEMTSPEYTRYFHGLPLEQRARLGEEHKQLYKGISGDLVDDIFDTLYRLSIDGPVPTELRAGVTLEGAAWDAGDEQYTLEMRHVETGETFRHTTTGLVLATGYRPLVPGFIEPVRDRIRWDERGRYDVALGYTIDDDGRIFVQNAEEHTHGLVAPDLGMGAFRSATIINAMCGREVYAVEKDIAFQTFGAPVAGAVEARA